MACNGVCISISGRNSVNEASMAIIYSMRNDLTVNEAKLISDFSVNDYLYILFCLSGEKYVIGCNQNINEMKYETIAAEMSVISMSSMSK